MTTATGVRIFWEPAPDEDVAKYLVYSTLDKSQAPEFLREVAHAIPGPNYSDKRRTFYLDDLSGTTVTFYQVISVASSGVAIQDSGFFLPDGPVAAGIAARVKIDHNYPTPDNLQFLTESGIPIPQGMMRVYTRADYEAGQVDKPLFAVETREDGRWIRPVYVEPGMDYVVVADKEGSYASDPVVITV